MARRLTGGKQQFAEIPFGRKDLASWLLETMSDEWLAMIDGVRSPGTKLGNEQLQRVWDSLAQWTVYHEDFLVRFGKLKISNRDYHRWLKKHPHGLPDFW